MAGAKTLLTEPPSAPVLVAFSGGPDSTALLHALARQAEVRARGLRALHVDHGLHPDSARWAQHCRAFAASLGVDFETARVRVTRDGGEGLEAAARAARYQALREHMHAGEWIALGHHRGDQAETFLLRALRASGPDGLAAMRPLREFGAGWLWRPLLDLPRQVILDYLADHRLPYLDDPANVDPRHDRSRLRAQIMPLLRERWPELDAALARSAALCAEAIDLLGNEDARCLATLQSVDPQALHVPALLDLPAARRARVLRRWIAELGLPPLPAEGVARIEAGLLPARADTEAEFAWDGAVIRRWRDLLHAERRHEPLRPDYQMTWDGRTSLHLPTGDVLSLEPFQLASVGAASAATGPGAGAETCTVEPAVADDAAQGQERIPATPVAAEAAPAETPRFESAVIVRPRAGGERIALPGRKHSHALKHVLQELGVPPWERPRLPLLFAANGELLAAGDLVASASLATWLRAHGTRLRWQRANP